MSLPRCLTRDFFTNLADSISNATDQYFQDVHESPTTIKLLCLQQSCIADNKFLIETLDGTVPIEYKHTCLALVPPTADGDRQLVGKVISFNQYKIAPTKSRYLIVLTRITIIPGDYRHLIGHLVPALIYHPVSTLSIITLYPIYPHITTTDPLTSSLPLTDSYPPEVSPAVSSFNYLSLKSRATPRDRGEGNDWTSCGLPVADLREAKGEVNREADGRKTSSGEAPCNGKYGSQLVIVTDCEMIDLRCRNCFTCYFTEIGCASECTESSVEAPNIMSGPIRKPQENLRNVKNVMTPYNSKQSSKKQELSPVRICDLTLYTPKWLIRARVVHKSEIRKFNNQRGENQLFSIDLCDVNGEIRAVFFGEAVTKWYTFLEEGQVYSISGGQLKPSNKKFNTLKHSCEMILDENSHIQLFQNDESIPSMCCSFTPLKQIDNVNIGETVDVLAVVVRAKDIQNIQSKGGNTVDKRDLLLCDTSGATIWLTVWGANSQVLSKQENPNPILCFKGVRVGNWQGRKLDSQNGTHVIVEPIIPEALELRKWWNENSHTVNLDPDFEKPTDESSNELLTLSNIISLTNQALQFKSIDSSGMSFTTRGLIEMIRDTNFSWPACPNCKKKMINKEANVWNCTRCDANSDPIHSYILSMKIVDDTSHIWATALTNVAQEIMNGIPASSLVQLSESGGMDAHGRSFSNIFDDARLNVRATVENFMDEPKIKYRVTKATPIFKELNYNIENRINNIKKMLAV